jgi:replicative DNA helicase
MENIILSGLLNNEGYARKVIPFLNVDYFQTIEEIKVFTHIAEYIEKYNSVPTKQALSVSLEDDTSLNENSYKDVCSYIQGLEYDDKTDLDWLVEKTEKFCQDRAIYNAVRESIQVLDGQHKSLDKGSIPDLLSKALSVSFDSSIGHDFLENSDTRFEFYHTKEEKIAFDLDLMNQITKGGLSKKSLSIALAGTGVGKTLFMTHCAAANMMDGKNVLYITMEMAEERIAERIDANLLNTTVDDLKILTKDAYDKKLDRVKGKTSGKLIIKEYPTASAGSGHFRHLINELRLKRNFSPDIIYIDYLNICASSRMKMGASVNSYTYIKAIAEELRGLAVEFNVPIVSATQTTRSGYSNSDMGLEDTSESFGLPATADFMFGLISSEELEDLGQLMIKQLKNRWGDVGTNKRFVVGIDRARMKLFDVDSSAQTLSDESAIKPSANNFNNNVTSFSPKDKPKPDFGGFK